MKSRFTRAATVAAITLLSAAPLTSHAASLNDVLRWFGIRPAPAAPSPAPNSKGKPAPPRPNEDGPGHCNPTSGC